MVKKLLSSLIVTIIVLIPDTLMGQQTSGLYFGGQTNVDVYKPYSEFGKAFNDKHNSVSSSTFAFHIFYNLPIGEKNSFGFGLCFKKIDHKITNRFDYQMLIFNQSPQQLDTFVFYSPATLHSKSYSLGTHLEFIRVVHSKKHIAGLVGLSSQFYFLEFFDARYNKSTIGIGNPWPMMYDTPSNFFFSSANASVNYALEFKSEKAVSFRLKASLGTNLYSDWDQFSKYVWIGLGAELGIPFRKKGHAISTSSKVK